MNQDMCRELLISGGCGLVGTEKWVINNGLIVCYFIPTALRSGGLLRWLLAHKFSDEQRHFCSGVAAAVLDGVNRREPLLQPAAVFVDSDPMNTKGGGG